MFSSDSMLPTLLAGVAGALATYGLARLAASKTTPDRRGWRHVRPGPMYWSGCVLAGTLVGLMGYVALFVGSSRPDAAFQMQVLHALLAVFAAGGLLCLWQMRSISRAAVSWRGVQIAYRAAGGPRQVRAMRDVTEMRNSPLSGITVRFVDGASLRLDPYASGTSELCERIIAAAER